MEKPIVESMSPDASTVGSRIKLIGSKLDSVTEATVGGVKAAAIEHVTDAILIITVAADAKSGPVVVSNEAGAAGTTPHFTVTTEPKPRAETKAEQAQRETREAQQKERAEREQASQSKAKAAEKAPEVTHHEHEAHREEQVARTDQQWPNKHKKKW